MICVAAELVGMHPQTLRIYEPKGLVRPKRTAGNTRLYSDADVERLRLIQRLTTELGLNLAGVERVLHLEDELRAHAPRGSTAWSARCARRSARCTGSTGATSSSTGPQPAADPKERLMDFNKLTIKSQEAVAAAQELARRRGNPEIYPEHLLLALLDQELFADWQHLRAEAEAEARRAAERERRRSSCRRPRPRSGRCSTAPTRSARSSRTTSSRASTSSSRSSRRRARRSSPWIKTGARRAARHLAGSRGHATRRSRSSAAT